MTIHNFSPHEYRAKKQNWSIIQDNRGIMYFANSAGILEYDSVEWRLYPLPGGSGAYALARDSSGRIYVGGEKEMGYLEADEKGLMQYHSWFYKIPPSYQPQAGRVVQVGFIPRGTVFLFERLLVILEGEKINVFTAEDHFYVFVYACGTLYIIDDTRGLLRYSGGRLIDVPGGTHLRAYVMLPFQGDKILILTTQEGPVIFAPQDKQNPYPTFNTPAQKKTLPGIEGGPQVETSSGDFFTGNLISCGLMLENQSFVLGSVEKGIAVFDPHGNQVNHIQNAEGLQDRHVYSIFLDAQGNLWAGLDQGISLISSTLLIDSHTSPRVAKVGTQPSIPFAALIRSCRKSADDTLIFGGTYYISTSRIQSIQQNRELIPAFAYAYNAFRFTFGCNHYLENDKTMYSCYLEGLDKGWSDWTTRNSREYTNLSWGNYTLRVKAKNASGQISQEATYTFTVKSPWYETFWFLAAQICFIILVLIASRFMELVGLGRHFSQRMIIFAVIIIFEYFNGFIGPIIGRYSNGIAFFGMLMTAMLSFIISPAQEFVLNILHRVIKGKRK